MYWDGDPYENVQQMVIIYLDAELFAATRILTGFSIIK